MVTNLDRYKRDLDSLISAGVLLEISIRCECDPAEDKKALGTAISVLQPFNTEYQRWYSEAKMVIKQLLPDRLADFVGHYERPKPRKNLTYESYRIEDYFLGLTVTSAYGDEIVGPAAAISHVSQQLAILKAVRARFESSLFDIRQLVRADLFDSELDAAAELAKNKFLRAAGAVAGVVLEKHLFQVCANHSVTIAKKAPGISYLNELKAATVIDIPQWRSIQHLGDIRNLCDHGTSKEPTPAQIDDLIAGVVKLVKTLF